MQLRCAPSRATTKTNPSLRSCSQPIIHIANCSDTLIIHRIAHLLSTEKLEPDGGEELLQKAAALAERYAAPVKQEALSAAGAPHTVDTIHADAVSLAPVILRTMRAFVERAGGTFKLGPPVGKVSKGTSMLSDDDLRATVKQKYRTQEKIDTDYNGDCTRVVDILRASAVFEKPAEAAFALELLEQPESELRVVRAKDRFGAPIDGYRDMILNGESRHSPGTGIIHSLLNKSPPLPLDTQSR